VLALLLFPFYSSISFYFRSSLSLDLLPRLSSGVLASHVLFTKKAKVHCDGWRVHMRIRYQVCVVFIDHCALN
jgi:hypothetical protein